MGEDEYRSLSTRTGIDEWDVLGSVCNELTSNKNKSFHDVSVCYMGDLVLDGVLQ